MRRLAVARVLAAAPTKGMPTPVTLEASAFDEVARLMERGSGSSGAAAEEVQSGLGS